ncbi:unnamed protein product, partial [Schistosoma curassoni]|uniref:Uncharacterized protein n=1 Tax=Schistosoma curassoni TaxID=6186 RepID=A0A183K313_9TREM
MPCLLITTLLIHSHIWLILVQMLFHILLVRCGLFDWYI